jgi:hypothetical protein
MHQTDRRNWYESIRLPDLLSLFLCAVAVLLSDFTVHKFNKCVPEFTLDGWLTD